MMAGVKRKKSTDADICVLHKEWDEVSCPICMDHPHNAVLLLCSSHGKGCRTYICDTSSRHSNCLDRFKKLRANLGDSSLPSSLTTNPNSFTNHSDMNLASRVIPDLFEINENPNQSETNTATPDGLPRGPGESSVQDPDRPFVLQGEDADPADSGSSWERIEVEEFNAENMSESKLCMKCPLCRGTVLGWEVVEEARQYLNTKQRSCSQESCSFSGNYQDLRRHARRIHPTIRPADIDPSRERAWRLLERQREYDDLVSAVRSAMPGAVVLGDYVIENGERENGTGEANGPLLSTFFLFQMFGSLDSVGETRGPSRGWTRHRRSAGAALSGRRFYWGENLLGLHNEDEDNDDDYGNDLSIFNDAGEDAPPVPRRRRRLTRSRTEEDEPREDVD